MDKVDLKWHIGKEGTQHTRLDLPPYRAYFTWHAKGQIIQSADFDIKELEDEITRLREAGENPDQFRDALERLSRQQG